MANKTVLNRLDKLEAANKAQTPAESGAAFPDSFSLELAKAYGTPGEEIERITRADVVRALDQVYGMEEIK